MNQSADLFQLLSATQFAAQKHRTQRRKDLDSSPYVNHPIEVTLLLAGSGVQHLPTLQAAVLHDTLEDTETTHGELEDRFGKDVADLVAEVTDDKSLDKAERKRLQVEGASKKSHSAALIKLADKICNLRDILDSPPVNWSAERKCEYFQWAKSVVDRLPPVSPQLKASFDALYARRIELAQA